MPMRAQLIATFAAVLALAGCVSDTVYYAQGVTNTQRDLDVATCTQAAFDRYPARIVTRFPPPRYEPPRQRCDSAGNCTYIPGYFRSSPPIRVDVNEAPREAAFRGCMAAEGYERVELPFCEAGTAVVRETRMPPLTGGTCLLRQRDATPLVVNPG